MHVSVIVTNSVIFFSFFGFHSIISHRADPSVLQCFSPSPFIIKHLPLVCFFPPVPRLPSLVLLCACDSLKAEIFCLSPVSHQSSPSLPYPHFLLLCLPCVQSIRRPPQRAGVKCAWAGIEKRGCTKRKERALEKARGRK